MPTGHGDERRLTQVLLNLVGNAIKFTDQGEVDDQGVRRPTARSRVAVRDTGPGISEADQAKIFEEFQQADNSDHQEEGRHRPRPLDLASASSRCTAASIWVESELGKGSVFQFTLPVNVVVQPQNKPM